MGSTKRSTARLATFIILRDGDKVLLQRRFNTGWMDGMYTFISGHVERGERTDEAIIREAKEEGGIEVVRENLRLSHIQHTETDHNYVNFYYEARIWEGVPTIVEPDKCDGLDWFAKDQLPDNMVPLARNALKYIDQKIIFSEYGFDEEVKIYE